MMKNFIEQIAYLLDKTYFWHWTWTSA